MRTGQSVEEQTEVLHGRAEAEFRRNVACAARRSFLVRGTLVYQTGQDEHKVDAPLSSLRERSTHRIALQRPSSVGILPVKKLIERLSVESLLGYRSINLSRKVLTGQLVAA